MSDDASALHKASAAALVLATGAALLLDGAGLPLRGAEATIAACAAILLLGMPHGALDLRMLVARAPLLRLGVYLGLAGAMFLAWSLAPIAALCGFLIMAVAHFAEDWSDLDEPFLAHGVAAGLLSAPGLLHLADLQSIFAALAGEGAAAALGDVLRLTAPVAMGLAVIGVLRLVQKGEIALAWGTGTALAALTFLPPAVGFALFFGLLHSPKHLWAELPQGADARRRVLTRMVLPATLLALGIAAGLALVETRPTLDQTAVMATFMVLSILTTPHMLAPRLIRLMETRPRL